MTKYFNRLWYGLFPPTLSSEQRFLLEEHSTYFQRLNAENQTRFAKRVAAFVQLMDFKSKDLPKITSEMKVLIGSAYIQISFGYQRFLPKHFQQILLMKGRYRFRNAAMPFLGHVDMQAKMICLSWEDVKTGFAIPDDAFNVALHEMMHVWEAEHHLNEDFEDIFMEKQLKKWRKVAVNHLERIKSGQCQFLREYGGQNQRELLATCVEAFFEQPKAFKKELPDLFEVTTTLLQQNPLQAENPLL